MPVNSPNYETTWRRVAPGAASGEYGYPALFELSTDAAAGEDLWLKLGEAGIDGSYPATRLLVEESRTWGPEQVQTLTVDHDLPTVPTDHAAVPGSASLFHVHFPSPAFEAGARSERPFASPWRTVTIGDIGTTVESTLTTDVSPSSELDATDWIEPGRTAWSWWAEGQTSARDFERQREYVDYAAAQDWDYVLVDRPAAPDGQVPPNEEWLPEFVEYASARDVGVWLWSHYAYLDSPEKRAARLPRWADWGVVGIKVDHWDGDTQHHMALYDRLLEAAAEQELMVNLHGCTTPRGRARSWPNLVDYEAIHGAEWYNTRQTIRPQHNVIAAYTRNSMGPMDYTPVTFSAPGRLTSAGHELALSVVFFGGLGVIAERPEELAARPVAEAFLAGLPNDWAETVHVGGRPDTEATLARRHGQDWYVGSITAGRPRRVHVPLSFLRADRPYRATVVRDGAGPDSLIREDRGRVTHADTLSVPVTANGGFSVELEALDPRRPNGGSGNGDLPLESASTGDLGDALGGGR
jgi:hypothetical protein